MPKDIKFINDSRALSFNIAGFAINPLTGSAWFGGDFRDMILTAVGTGTLIVLGSAQRLPPDFTAASTITNSYTPIRLADYSTIGATSFYAGATGITLAATTEIVELDTNLLTWIAITRDVGTLDILATFTNAQ